ncbi:hypothetical protein SAMN05444398_10620 [Roseovarius pacificus]|uniref:Uncharacterized protein n=1 Tax=Roseovarius pacificus TaxID=337701 RepID=A0A1M7DRR4_9RHOB|nr:hypothetical protein SAMN05444398_10620 [Roseovarius pacificus]
MYSILLWVLRFFCAIGAVDSTSLAKARAKDRAKTHETFWHSTDCPPMN